MLTKSPPSKTAHPGNNFDFIRVLAASMVLYSHHYSLTGQQEPSFFGIHSLGGLSVTIFFIISGYLVAASWQRDPNLWRFALRRFLRIWPALTVVIFLAAYALGPWVTRLPLNEYLTHPATAHYLRGILMNISFVLPGVFEQNPYPLGVNGSLWTIPIEVKCYIFLGLAGMLGLLKNRVVFLFCIALFMAWFLARTNADITGVVDYPRELGAFFLAGAALHALKSHWSRHPLLWALSLSLATIAMWSIDWRHTALLIGLPFAVIYAGTHATPFLRRFGRWGDPSYGIYLFAFPVQQTIIFYCWPEAGFAGTLAVSLLTTVALAYASWHLIEKQALKFKPSSQPQRNDMETLRQFIRHLPMKWFWPLLAAAVGLRFIFRHLDAPVLIDPTYTYLPAAQAFLDQGWAFLLTPQSYQVTPLAYLWPALWGADPTWIRIANMGLWLGCVWFLWRTCCMLGGLRAGAVAMVLLCTPEMVRYFPSEMTEPLYLFGLFGWMYAVARIVIARENSVTVIVQAAVMLTITLLSRPVFQLIAPTALLACLFYLAYGTLRQKAHAAENQRRAVSALAWSLGLALILPIALVIKNGLVFGLWGLGTGSGIGLYLGTHPLFQGAEPAFLGFDFDVNALVGQAAQTDNPLSLAGDLATRSAALWQLHTMSQTEMVSFFARKLWWWLAHHPAQVEALGGSLRKLRFLELAVLVVTCVQLANCWLRRKRSLPMPPTATAPQLVFAAFLLTMFLAMLAQLLPILYNARYSSALLDPWLIPLTAFGIAHFLAHLQVQGAFRHDSWGIGLRSSQGTPIWRPIGVIVGILVMTFAAYNVARKHESNTIDPERVGKTHTHLDIRDGSLVQTYGMSPQGEREWRITESPAVLQVPIDSKHIEQLTAAHLFNALWETQIALQADGKPCGKAEIAYQTADGRILQPSYKLPLLLAVQTHGTVHSLVTHANHELRPREPGSLRVVLHCPVDTVVQWHGTRLLESQYAADAAAHIKH